MDNYWMHPALPLLIGALILPFLTQRLRCVALVVLPAFGLLNVIALGRTDEALIASEMNFAGYVLDILHVDKLSLMFGYLFHIAALIGGIYAMHLKDRMQHFTGVAYAGSAVAAVFAGDLLTLFLAWELLAVTSVFLVWAGKGVEGRKAGGRYLLAHIMSGLLLLIGTALLVVETGVVPTFEHMELDSMATWLIFLAFGIKVGFPIFHTWLVDAYPASSASGTLFLSAFTTKTAVYCLARGFAGEDMLIYIGAVMCLFPIFYAVIENDLRRVLSYSMINQIGFMVVGIGIGTTLSVNGAVAHAFADVIFKGLLFMAMGAVYLRVGSTKGTELGGLYKSMPWTTGFCLVGAASISALPLFSGFVTKSMIMFAAATYQPMDLTWLWFILLFASAGVLEHAGIKIPYFAFFAHDSGKRPKEAPMGMRVAMGISSVLCILIGCFPQTFYQLLPGDQLGLEGKFEYAPYTLTHIVTQMQLLFFAAAAVFGMMLLKKYPAEVPSVNVDTDVIWRKVLPGIWKRGLHPIFLAVSAIEERFLAWAPAQAVRTFGHGLPRLAIFKEWPQGSIILLITIVLCAYLGLELFS
jgi:multicomponent Na+:H+ antiporter subunit D